MNFAFMTRRARDMPIEMDSDSEFVHSSHHPRNGFDLDGDASGRQPGNLTDQHNSNEPHYTSVYELARPIWPANDVVTPAISERKIRRLECGNDDEKLMAAFARHVISAQQTMHEHRPKPLQQDQADITDSEGQSKAPRSSSPAANEMRAVKTILIPKICDILKDFPTTPEDESFPPLLRQLVTATVANTPQAVEERHLDLLTYVVTHCTSSSPTDQVKTASLVRRILKILSRHRQNLAGQTHSQIQRDINAAARANDLNWLRVLHAELLLFEAQHDGDQNGQ